MSADVITVVEGSEIPAPPPPPVAEEAGDDFNPSRQRLLYKVWDRVAIFGPISDNDIYMGLVFASGGSWRAYLRMHPGTDPKAYEKDANLLHDANRWHMDQEIAFGLDNEYLKRDAAGLLTIGSCPPEHTALQSVGGESGVSSVIMKEGNSKALETLRAKTNPARRKPDRAKKALLKKSLETVGQLDPIRMWQPPNMGADPIVINGQTRKELLESMGIEPRIEWLPARTTATEALLQRIHHEVYVTSKDQSESARDAYIAQLAAEGWSQEKIASEVGVSQKTVSKVLAKVSDNQAPTSPTEEEIIRWVAYNDAGWSYRDIATFLTGWGKSTIERYADRYRVTMASKDAETKESIKKATALIAAAEIKEEVEKEEVEEILSHIKPSQQSKTPEGRRKQAAKAKPLVDAAKSKGRSPKSAMYVARDTNAMKIAILADDDSTKAAVEALIEKFGGSKTLDQILSELS
jgi:transposase